MKRLRTLPLRRWLAWGATLAGAAISGAWHAVAADVPSADSGPVPIADVIAFTPLEGREDVTVDGVVTLKLGEGLVLQDDSAGAWIDVTQSRRLNQLETDLAAVLAVREGDVIEVAGLAKRGGYAPTIVPRRIRVRGQRPLPPARPYDRTRFFLGLDDCLRVEAAGIVRGFREDAGNGRRLLLVADVTREFWVDADQAAVPLPLDDYVDANIRCVGVATAEINSRGELLAPRLNVCRADELIVVTPPGPIRDKPLAEVGRYPDDAHRIRTQGVVTYAEPGGTLYLQAGYAGVLVESPSMIPVEVGDWVEVVGFVDGSAPVFSICEAEVRRLRQGTAPQPIAIQPADIVRVNAVALSRFDTADPGDYYGCLITFPATVVDVSPGPSGGEIRLLVDNAGVTAVTGLLGLVQGRQFEPGSRVQVTGIVRPVGGSRPHTLTAERPMPAPSLEILLRSPDDLKLLRAATWWKPHRLATVIAGLAALVLATLGWVGVLRRQVSRHVAIIEEKLQFEAVAGERLRIAREFHDTLEQDLAGIALRLDAAADLADDEQTRGVLEQQRGLLEQVRRETHDFLWDLRDPTRTDGSFVESLASQVAYLRTLTNVPISLQLDTAFCNVSPTAQFHMLRIVREAVNNSLKHGNATHIDIRLAATAEGWRVETRDDGRGFEVGPRTGMEGHFGLRGMAERASRIGARLSVESRPGHGAIVRIDMPVEQPAVS